MTIILFNSLVNGYFKKSNKILNKSYNLITFIKYWILSLSKYVIQLWERLREEIWYGSGNKRVKF